MQAWAGLPPPSRTGGATQSEAGPVQLVGVASSSRRKRGQRRRQLNRVGVALPVREGAVEQRAEADGALSAARARLAAALRARCRSHRAAA